MANIDNCQEIFLKQINANFLPQVGLDFQMLPKNN
jgi:hypothetical protein